MAPLLAGCDDRLPRSRQPKRPSPTSASSSSNRRLRALVRELPGRVAPTRVSDVRPRISGIVTERLFDHGSEVKAGDPLYRIDPRPFEVEVQSSEAALAKAVAAFDQASQQARRIATLTSQKATSEAENEKAIGAMRQAEAEVEGRKAEVARARLNLELRDDPRPDPAASSARRWSAKARSWCRTRPIWRRFSSSIRSTPTSRNRSPNSISSGARSRAANSTASRPTWPGFGWCSMTARSMRRPASCCSRTPGWMPIPGK